MSNGIRMDITSADFLRNNPHVYALKAKRKKIALISVEGMNRHSAEIVIPWASSKLIAGDQSYSVETPDVIIRKFSEFTWDFVVYAILDFSPLLAVVDGFFFLTGPLYNRRLRKQLHLLSDGEMVLRPGETKKVILGFRGVTKAPSQLHFSYRCDGGEQQIACDIR